MKYFLPDWEDRVDPGFKFIRDDYSKGHKSNPYSNDVYAHQIYDSSLPYDGLLISLSIFRSKLKLKNHGSNDISIRNHSSIKEYLKITKSSKLKVLGDCGAFSYINEKNPPDFFNTKSVANIYDKLGFDYGVSVDHMVLNYYMQKNEISNRKEKVELSQKEKERRVNLTLENSREFLEVHKDKHYKFVPIGVAQGYDKKSYAISVRKLVDFGYRYIGIGSLVQYSTNEILSILAEILPELGDAKLHLFGVLRSSHLSAFEKYGVISFDSASYLRKAWLRSGQNYLSPDNRWYAAIRVPYSNNPTVIKNSKKIGIPPEKLKKMEQKALNDLREFDKGLITIDRVLKSVIQYDNLLTRNSSDGINLEQRYKRTLEEKPWKNCQCQICKQLGIDVVIFRGSNRNKRRGFHNSWIFNHFIKDHNTDCQVTENLKDCNKIESYQEENDTSIEIIHSNHRNLE